MTTIQTIKPVDIKYYPTITQTSPHESCSTRYAFVPTIEPLKVLESCGWVPVKIDEVRARTKIGYQKHLVRLRNPKYRTSEGYPEIIMVNSHCRTSTFKLFLGFYRLVCANGLMVGNTLEHYSIAHVGYADSKIELATNQLTESVSPLVDMIHKLECRSVTYRDQFDFVNDVLDTLEINADFPHGLLFSNRKQDGEVHSRNAWQMLNVVQENLMRGNYQIIDKNNRTRKARQVKAIDTSTKVNRLVWDVAASKFVS